MPETVFVKKQIWIGDKWQDIHLGDVLILLNLLYNRAKTTQVPIDIYGPLWIAELFAVFDFQNISFLGDNYTDDVNKPMNFSFAKLMPRIHEGAMKNNMATSGFINGNCFCHIVNGHLVEYSKFELPKVKLNMPQDKRKVTYFQFDARSRHDKMNKFPLNTKESIEVINRCIEPDTKAIGIGGKDTLAYLDYKFELGNLIEISQRLCECSKFIGVDSGISHLAGSLGVKGEIVNMFINEPVVSEIIQLYSIYYPTMKCHKRDEFFNKTRKTCKIHL